MHTQILESSDLEMLTRVLHHVCKKAGHQLDSDDAQNVATKLVYLFQSGMVDEFDLIDTMEAWSRENQRYFG
ncbi:hypothetical protein P9272_34705 [Mesorhizobium sp. WSM4976]|uniref:hypothetical protein n=1 Tax=Mesorhizobium sp. WSM4976 TaxID=3038549 RepID=UPI0024170A47|nr:hypothetical protein [Mesorhizobium sp. WSM4976]MDG4898665.1 hypothetical protein [Mesorhizobium sp. WSM4976]